MALSERKAAFLTALLADPKRRTKQAALAAGVPEGSAKTTGRRWRELPEVVAALQVAEGAVATPAAASVVVEVITGEDPNREGTRDTKKDADTRDTRDTNKPAESGRRMVGICQLPGWDEEEKSQLNRHRPTSYNAELAEELCYQIATSAKGLKWICDAEETFPSHRTVLRWLTQYDEFCHMYSRAREMQGDFLAFEGLVIADDDSLDIGFKADAKGDVQQFLDRESIARSKLRVDHRKWLAAKLAPRKYGEKLELSATGPRSGNPLADVLREIQEDPTPTVALSKRFKVIEIQPEEK